MIYIGDNPVKKFAYRTWRKIFIFFGSIKRVVQWAPIIWKDRDWDWAYLFTIMDYKLKKMSDSFAKAEYHDHTKDIQQIKVVRALIKRITEDEYSSIKTDYIEKEFGVKRTYNFEPIEGSECSRMVIGWEPEQTAEQSKFLNKIWDNAHRDSVKQMENDVEYLFTFMRKHVRKWWD